MPSDPAIAAPQRPVSGPAPGHAGAPEARLDMVDAMRALAVLAVVLFHVFPKALPGGFIGVDIFFAISGFVIALRYLDPLIAGETGFGSFFARRIRRLVPAYAMLLVAVTIVALVIMTPKDLTNFGQSLAAQALYLQNVAFWQQGDYFDDPLLKPLLHTWSLAVEEQFYLAFPLLVLLLRWRRRWGLALLVLATLGSLAFGMLGTRLSPVMTFYLLPFRVWEFTLGIIAALLYQRLPAAPGRTAPLASGLVLAGLAMMLAAIAGFGESAPFPGPQAAIALAGAFLVLIGQRHAISLLHRLAGWAPIQHAGRISYSWYLWHWPAVAFPFLVTGRALTLAEALAALLAGYILAELSYRYVETWGQRTARLKPPRRTAALLAGFTGFALVAGLTLLLSDGLIDRYTGRSRALYAAQMDRPPRRCPLAARLAAKDRLFCRIDQAESHDRPGILLIGDSHADLMKPELARMARGAGRPFYLVQQDCRVIDYGVDRNCPAKAWPKLLRQIDAAGIGDVIVISRYTQDFDPARFRHAILDLAATGVHVTIEPTTPESPEFDPETWIRQGRADSWPDRARYRRADYLRDNRVLLATMRPLARRDDVTLIEPLALLCPDRCLIARGAAPLYHDPHHLTSTGAALVAPLYRSVITAPRVRSAKR